MCDRASICRAVSMTFPTLETTVFREGRRKELDELAEVRVIADGEWNVAIDYHLSQKHIHVNDFLSKSTMPLLFRLFVLVPIYR